MAGQMIGGGLGGLGGLGIGDETGVAAAQLGMAHPAMQQAMQQGMQQQGMQPHGMMQPGMQPQAAQWQVRNLSSCGRVPERVLIAWRARACSSLRSPRCTSTSRPGSSKRWRQRCALSPRTTLCTSHFSHVHPAQPQGEGHYEGGAGDDGGGGEQPAWNR